MASSSLAERAIVVTGSSLGIGRAVAKRLASEGAAVVVNGRTPETVEAVRREIAESGGRACAQVGSAADFAVAGALVECCIDTFGRIDGLINCAGIAEPAASSILDIDPAAWREVVDSHLTATFNTCRHAAPRLVQAGGGAIVNTSSHAYLGHYGGTAYPAGKGGVNGLTFAIAAELREHGVRANAVCPGARTRLSRGEAYEAKIRELHARGLMNDVQRDASLSPEDPEHVGPLYALLVGPRSAGITGRLFTAAGGYVGAHDVGGRETLLAFRDASTGPWPVDALADAIEARLRDA